jgi:hypothetical protein
VISAHCWAKMTATEGFDAWNDHMLFSLQRICAVCARKSLGGVKAVNAVECSLKNVHGSGLPNRSCE